MARRHRDEVILARWTVDTARLRDFALQVRARYGAPFRPDALLKACENAPASGLEVVCRDDAIFVGPWSLDLQYNLVSGLRLEETWILCDMDWGAYDIPIPVPPNGRVEAARVVAHYIREWEEENRQYFERRNAPTWHNRLLDIAEAHFAWVALGFFFIVIPLVLLLFSLLRHQ